MSNKNKRDMENLGDWAEEEKKEKETVNLGNITILSGLSLFFTAAVIYYSGENESSIEYDLGIQDEEFEYEEEYVLITDKE